MNFNFIYSFEQAFKTMVMVMQAANAELDVGVSTPQPFPALSPRANTLSCSASPAETP